MILDKFLNKKGVEELFNIILDFFYKKTETNTLLDKKVDKVNGKDLSSNDYIDTDKEKLINLPLVVVLESEDDYNALDVKEDNTLYLIKGNPGLFTTQNDLDILETTITTDIDSKLSSYQLKSNMVNYVDSREFTELTNRVAALESKMS